MDMIHFSELMAKPVHDNAGQLLGSVSDFAVLTREMFPRVTSITFLGREKNKPPVMLAWEYVDSYDETGIRLNAPADELNFSYLKPNELLLNRDLLDRQIVDTQGLKVVRVNDLKLIDTPKQLRLVGADVGFTGLLRRMGLDWLGRRLVGLFGGRLGESLIAWNYIEPLERDLSHVRLSVTHKRLHELHPADVADIVEQLDPEQRAKVFRYMDIARAADTLSETEPDVSSDLIEDLDEHRASDILEIMPPDEAADILSDLSYEKAEKLLGLMGVKEARAVRSLLGYHEKTAGGIMTTSFLRLSEELTVDEAIGRVRASRPEVETIYYAYVVDGQDRLKGVVSLRDLITGEHDQKVVEIMERDLITVGPDEDQENVAMVISKYDLLAAPVLDEDGVVLGIVTVDDVIDVLEEESSEDLALLASFSIMPLEAEETPRWFAERTRWFVSVILAGAIASLIIRGYSGGAPILLPTILFIPFVIRLCDDLSIETMTFLVSATKAGRLSRSEVIVKLTRDVGMALIGAILAFALVTVLSLFWQLGRGMAAVTGLAVFLTMLVSSLLGTLIAKLLLRYELEPSTAYAPFYSTGLAAIALALYLGMARIAG